MSNLDIHTRININDIVGYKSKHVPIKDLFMELHLDYNNRQHYGRIMGIINKDRHDFCQDIWNNAKDMIIEHSADVYKVLYKKCLESWYKENRTLLYSLGDGWGTPEDYDTFKKIEEGYATRDIQTVINKFRELSKVNITLPYEIDIDKLDNNLKVHRDLLEDSSEE